MHSSIIYIREMRDGIFQDLDYKMYKFIPYENTTAKQAQLYRHHKLFRKLHP